ncbi:hypothetical protein [Roseimaritima multifibrata]|uniref:hypothetical protein n=1 Tax=Roseimaritima multifibrata TaxID=1930274 RepID=UPI001C54C25C|nr:hypothetical protein [Roseimaritima multifibrata]
MAKQQSWKRCKANHVDKMTSDGMIERRCNCKVGSPVIADQRQNQPRDLGKPTRVPMLKSEIQPAFSCRRHATHQSNSSKTWMFDATRMSPSNQPIHRNNDPLFPDGPGWKMFMPWTIQGIISFIPWLIPG